MRTQRFAFLMTLVAVTLTPAARAGTLGSGTTEFTPSVAFNRSTFTPAGGGTSGSTTHLNLSGQIGRCLTDRLELGGGLLYQRRGETGTSRNALGASGGATLNFATEGSVVPFLSGGVGVLSYSTQGSSDRALLLPMVRAGFRTLMGEGRSVNVSIGFQHEANSKSTVEKDANMLDVGVGLSLFRTPVTD